MILKMFIKISGKVNFSSYSTKSALNSATCTNYKAVEQ
jgi:hypothetical protein